MKNYLIVFIAIFFTGCTSLFFQPQKEMMYVNTDYFEVERKIITKKVADSQLYGWHLKTDKKKKGTVVFLHGNGGNISNQIFAVLWLPWYGYDVITFDYRGYGNSTGKASIENIHEDVKAIFDFTLNQAKEGEKLYIFAQSLGGAVAISSLADYKKQKRFSKIVVDSAFSSYDKVAKEFLSKGWLTSLFSFLSSLVENKMYDPINHIQDIHVPIVLIHGKKDTLIDFKHSQLLYKKANEPKRLWLEETTNHIGLFFEKKSRSRLIGLLENEF